MRYDRDVLIGVVIFHQVVTGPAPLTFHCMCDWGLRPEHLGASFAQHIADVYEMAMLDY